MKSALALAFLVSLLSCKSSNSQSLNETPSPQEDGKKVERIGLGLNDISISFPFNAQVPGIEAILPRLADKPDPEKFAPGLPKAPEDGEGFVYATTEAEHFDLMGLPITPLGVNARKMFRTYDNMFKDYRLHGLRFVPCANDLEVLGNEAACLHTLQMNWDGPNDNTFHSIHRLSEQEFKDVLKTLVELHKAASIDTESMPLGTHPVMVKEGLESPYLKGILGLIHRYARASNLLGVAAMHTFTLGEVWMMNQFQMVNKKLVLLPGGETSVDDRASSTGEAQAIGSEFDANPFTLARRSAVRFFAGSGLHWKKHPTENRKVLGVVNPRLHNVRNLRCASCHTSGVLHDSPDAAEDPLRFTSNYWNLKIPKENDKAASGISIVMFSRGAVSQRVTNETAAAMNYLVEKGYLPKPSGWNEAPTVTQRDLDAVKISSDVDYRITNPSYPAKACFGVNAEQKIVGQKCGESNSQVYTLKGPMTEARLVNKENGLCLKISDDGKSFDHGACGADDKKQSFRVTGNIHIVRFENKSSGSAQCMESTFEDVDFNSTDPSKIRLMVSSCAASIMSLQKVTH